MNEETARNWFSKPGDALRIAMQRTSISAIDLATQLGSDLRFVRGLLDGSAVIDRDVADRLAAILGGTSSFWLKRQGHYEQALARAVAAVSQTDISKWIDVPAPGPKPRGNLTEERGREEVKRRLLFYNVPNLEAWEGRYGGIVKATRFRTSQTFESNEDAVLLWLRQGEIEADLVPTQPWNPAALRERIPAIRRLSRIGQPARFVPKLKALLSEAGVAFVVVRAPNGCRASGASKLVVSDKAMLLVSFRYRTDDQFWFTVFHEIGHLLLHGATTFVDDGTNIGDTIEQEANEFASSCILPEYRSTEFRRLTPDRESVIRFSVSVGIAPGLTVGQMQHRQMIERSQMNGLKRHWTWEEITPTLS